MTAQLSKIFFRALVVWLIIICAEILHAVLRSLFLEPFVGDFRARQIAVFTGALIILSIAFFFIKWLRAANYFQLFIIGFFWLILTISFEIAFGKFVLNLSWERIVEDYNILNGGLLPLGLLFLLFSPLIAAKIRKIF